VDAFRSAEVFPDAVLIDADLPAFGAAEKLIKRLQAQNATVTIMVLASQGNRLDAVSALQAGAADFMVSISRQISGNQEKHPYLCAWPERKAA